MDVHVSDLVVFSLSIFFCFRNYICKFACVHVCVSMHMEVKGRFTETCPLFLPCEFQGLNSGCLAPWQDPCWRSLLPGFFAVFSMPGFTACVHLGSPHLAGLGVVSCRMGMYGLKLVRTEAERERGSFTLSCSVEY